MVHPGSDPQTAARGAVHEDGAVVPVVGQLALQRSGQRRGVTRITRGLGGAVVGQQVGLDRGVEAVVQRLDLVGDRGEDALGERHQPSRGDTDARAVGGRPLGTAFEDAGAKVECPLVGPDLAVPDVERRVADVQADELAVGHVDDGLAGLREPVSRLGVGERALLVEATDVGARHDVRLTLLERAAQTDVPVRQGEQRLGRRQVRRVETRGPQVPRFDQERAVRLLVLASHDGPSSSDRSLTTTSAPFSRRASAWAATHSHHETEAAGPPGRDPRQGILEHRGRGRVDREQPGTGQEHVRRGLARQARHGRRLPRPPAPRRTARCRRSGSLRRRWPRR